MPEGKPTKAPLIIFSSIIGISLICLFVVLYTHANQKEPYLNPKIRKVRRVKRAPISPPVPTPTAADAAQLKPESP